VAWHAIDWQQAHQNVRRLQARIVKATQAGRWGKVKALQRLLTKGSKIHIQGRMTYPAWKDRKTGETRYGAEIVAQTLDYQGADEEAPQAEQPAAPVPQPAETVALAAESAPAKPKRSRSKKAQVAAA